MRAVTLMVSEHPPLAGGFGHPVPRRPVERPSQSPGRRGPTTPHARENPAVILSVTMPAAPLPNPFAAGPRLAGAAALCGHRSPMGGTVATELRSDSTERDGSMPQVVKVVTLTDEENEQIKRATAAASVKAITDEINKGLKAVGDVTKITKAPQLNAESINAAAEQLRRKKAALEALPNGIEARNQHLGEVDNALRVLDEAQQYLS